MKKTITLLFILIFSLIYSQENSTDESRSKGVVYGSMSARPSLEIKGSPYYNENFLRCKIGNSFDRQAKYNAATDELEYMQDGAIYTMYRKKEYNPVDFIDTKEKLLLQEYILNSKKTEGYLFVIYQSDFTSLFYKKSKKFMPEIKATNLYEKDIPPKYVNIDDVFFIQKNQGDIVELPLNKKKLSEMFPEKKDLINENFKSKNLDLSKPLELQKFISIFKN